MPDVTRRMLDLLTLLQTGREYSCAGLAGSLGVSERTVRRDVDRLRGYGYPVRTRPGPGGHYRLAAGRAMPPVMLEDDEAVAILLGLAASSAGSPGEPGSIREAASRAYGKLEQILPSRLTPMVTSLRTSLEADSLPTVDAGIADISALATAIRDRRVVEFEYRRAGDAGASEPPSCRRVEPHRQVHHLLRWYLVAWDQDKQDWRIFRLDRLRALRQRTQTFEPRSLPTGTALDQVQAGANRDRTRVVLTVEASPAEVAAALPYEALELHSAQHGYTRVVLHSESWRWLLLQLSHLDRPVVVHEPRDWAEQIRRVAGTLLRDTGHPGFRGPE
ncbi:helix-turn-helix transcriptional regulator [Brachybacterium sp. GCM10030252]|uniref:helix-turn-helix transcriptional regulator n=1 Tax=Brachybacterium sp. GCM10030252 TaxID=3273380 RepID=UPI0036126F0B